MSDTNDEILHVIGRGVASLRSELAEAQRDAESQSDLASDNWSRYEAERNEHGRTKANLETERSRARNLTDRNDELKRLIKERADRAEHTLDGYDRITLALYHYIVELAGHRDTAKTKAERIALGHVVERLKEIRGIDDYERPETM